MKRVFEPTLSELTASELGSVRGGSMTSNQNLYQEERYLTSITGPKKPPGSSTSDQTNNNLTHAFSAVWRW